MNVPRPNDNTLLRILYSEAAIGFGGQEHRIFKEMLGMREAGHHVAMVCRPQAQLVARLQEHGILVHTVQMGGLKNFILGVMIIRRLLKQGKYDVLMTNSRKDTMIAALAARLAGTPLIVRTRHLASAIGSLLSYTGLPHRVIAVSDYVRQMIIDKGVAPEKVATIYTLEHDKQAPDQSSLRQELGLNDNACIGICVAVMREKKGHLKLLNAMLPLFKDRPDLHLVVVGSGSPTFERVQEFLEQHQLVQQIHLLGYRKDVPNLLAGADFFALATEQEAAGMVYIEAQLAALPVVATAVGGVPEMLVDGVGGFLVPDSDSQALRQAIDTLSQNRALRQKMGQAGYAWVIAQDKFTAEAVIKNLSQVLRGWLKNMKDDR